MGTRGFSLIEVLIALVLLVVAVLGVLQLVALAVSATNSARVQSLTVTLASARLEQLRTLTFDFDDTGSATTDLSTNLSTATPVPGGSGLTPGGSLDTSVGGYVDHLDRVGQWVGNSTSAPADAMYTRRWAVTASSLAPSVLVLEVAVFPVASPVGNAARAAPGSTRVATLIGRRQR